MAKYIIKDGKFVNQENGEAVSSLSGKLVRLEEFNTESNDTPRLRYCFASAAEGAEGDSFSVRRYGDASLKILRCLFGIADIIAGKTITVTLSERDGQKAAIVITADGEELTPRGFVGPYASEKNIFVDRLSAVIGHVLNFSHPVTVLAFPAGICPDGLDDAIAMIGTLRRSGNTDGLVVKKTVFTNDHAFNAYCQAFRDFGRGNLYTNLDAIARIEEAYTAPISVDDTSSDGDEDPDEEV